LWYYYPPGENHLVPEYFELAIAQESAYKITMVPHFKDLTYNFHNAIARSFGYIFNGGNANYTGYSQLSVGGAHPNQELEITDDRHCNNYNHKCFSC
jgi:hypothetical protein